MIILGQLSNLIFDHASRNLEIRIEKVLNEWVDDAVWMWLDRLKSIQDWEVFLNALRELPADAPIKQNECIFSVFNEKGTSKRQESYLDKVTRAQALIREGEIYQVNLSQPFVLNSYEKPFTIFEELAKKTPAPFAAYFKTKEVTIISCSPERFLSQKKGKLETRPIKGTIRRGKTVEEDLLLKECLKNSPKERSELLMITDLMRNDLGKVSKVGSVETLHLWKCEAYASIYHLVSVIQSIAKRNLSVIDVIRSCFPPGSITGCPKLRAIAVIDDLEGHARGIYTGSIGYIEGNGDIDLNVAIRTLVFQEGQYHLQLGSGIVYDSIASDEYQETLVKGKSFF